MNIKYYRFGIIVILLVTSIFCNAGSIIIKNNLQDKVITFGNGKIMIVLDYNGKCDISGLNVNGQSVISGPAGIFSSIRTSSNTYSTLKLSSVPTAKISNNQVTISNIKYGNNEEIVIENWNFIITENDIKFNIERSFPKSITIEEAAFPSFNFNNINTWNGAFLGYGGLAWFYLFNQKLCTYGVHTNCSTFWNSATGNALRVEVAARGKQVAMKYSRSSDDHLVYNVAVTDKELTYRYEAEKRSRFVRGKTDVWDSFNVSAGKYAQTITLSYLDYNEAYNRGKFVGVNGTEVTNLLNTIARIGVIDQKHFGGNSWHTPYGPICLHEQYIAQFAIGINDDSYTQGYKQCLDFYRDNAVQPDGRVIARWAYLNSDAMPGTVNKSGFYEAQWGYLMDSNPDFVTNVAEVYNLTGDRNWISTHKKTCEKALDYMLKRDSNNNHLVEMMTNAHSEKKGSDWIDIIWASYENAFINAKLYYALTLWANAEKQLGDSEKSNYYSNYAAELKKSFNKSTEDGGFWNDKNKWYVHWRDKDNSIHGDNLVVPVNFMAIVYGICDDPIRRNAILDKIEEQTHKENLFFWPICLYPYAVGEGNDWQFPFPNYENGDIFLSWGSIGVEAYANYNPDLALKYVDNVLDQYKKDGLAFQRYGRINQEGLGDDILSGNSLALVGLYKAIYGINPLYNRLYLNPHLPKRLSGTELIYHFRQDKLKIGLAIDNYSISNEQFKITSPRDFGFYSEKNELIYFHAKDDIYSLKAITAENLSIAIGTWKPDKYSWSQSSTNQNGKVSYSIKVSKVNSLYTVWDGKSNMSCKSDQNGVLKFVVKSGNKTISLTNL
ncbi:MAG: hypothetical protein Q8862_10955 [Bacteroidota bacterium]|nr:hypothetical protein [Bacteroidota bacterium]